MKARFINTSFATEHDDADFSPENSCASPRTTMFTDTKLLASTSSPKKGRRSIQKRVVSVPIKEVEGSRVKGEIGNTPPSDSWAWRKYGQKPIKGSPYPRGYYRCSSSKGCPARKQVERSRDDPNVLLITYSCEHNHTWPATKNSQKSQNNYSTTSITTIVPKSEAEEEEEEEEDDDDDKQQPTAMKDDVSSHKSDDEENKLNKDSVDDQQVVLQVIDGGEFGWLSDFECTSGDTMLGSQMLSQERMNNNYDEIMNIDGFGGSSSTMREEDELLFGDLGELPECSMVFRRGMIQRDEERRTPWCGTTT